jgi:hypothetical protein
LKALVPLVLYPSGTDLRTRMPTLSRLAWTLLGRTGCRSGTSSPGARAAKKDVIWRWAGSAEEPAKGRFVRGVDIVMFSEREKEMRVYVLI